MADSKINYPTQEWLDNWVDKWLDEHPDEKVEDFQKLYDDAEYYWWVSEIDKGHKTPHELTPEQEKVSHEARVTPGGTGKTKTKVERKRKPNDSKRTVIGWLKTLFEGLALNGKVADVTVTNIERSVDFSIDGKHYTLTLTEHRAPKA